MSTSQKKGDRLEKAVRWIEDAILQSSPALKEKTFRIESKKMVLKGGVHHEIDVYVSVELGNGYDSAFIFECKNWEAAVGKNEVIIFSKKIEEIGAQKGFFVAKSYTKDAKAQAAKDPRITLLTATEYSPENTPIPFDFHMVSIETKSLQIKLIRNEKAGAPEGEKINIEGKTILLSDKEIDLKKYLEAWSQEATNKDMTTFGSGNLPEGNYPRTTRSERIFDTEKMILDGVGIHKATIEIFYEVVLVRPAVISHFEIADRGRVVSLAPVSFKGITLDVAFLANGTPPSWE